MLLSAACGATGTEIIDGPQQISHSVSPADLVDRILTVRCGKYQASKAQQELMCPHLAARSVHCNRDLI